MEIMSILPMVCFNYVNRLQDLQKWIVTLIIYWKLNIQHCRTSSHLVSSTLVNMEAPVWMIPCQCPPIHVYVIYHGQVTAVNQR